jgi:hypothetical protein
MITLGMLIAVFVLLVVGLFSFEVNRLSIARQQLTAACDAAALAAAATLASSDNLDPVDAHVQAINTALTSFQQNAVVGVPLQGASIAGSKGDRPNADHSSIFIEFLNPHNNNETVSLGDPDGKIVRISGAFGLEPSFGKFLGLGSMPIYSGSSGGVPALDVVLAFDVSASIDDQTPVTFVRRQWNPNSGKISYHIANTSPGSKVGGLARGKIYDIIGPPPIGSAVDGAYPQSLSASNDTGTKWPLFFSEEGTARGLRGPSNTGTAPGNKPPGNASVGSTRTYTDLVVNVDGNDVFGGLTVDGYNFPDVATLVEAARGNLENDSVFTNSQAKISLPSNVFPRAGYQAKYFELAAANSHPLHDAQIAAREFLTIMNTNTDAHFSLVAFSSNAGTGPNTVMNMYNVDPNYANAGRIDCPVPCITLDKAKTVTKFTECYDAVLNTRATSGTNIGDAIFQSVNQLKTNSRPASKKAIVLFTDGEPTYGGPLSNDPHSNARLAAVQARNAGVAIYSIGLAQNPEIIPSETAILTHQNSNPSSGGVSGIAGNGGKFFLVTDVGDLRATFENIARQLVSLVR